MVCELASYSPIKPDHARMFAAFDVVWRDKHTRAAPISEAREVPKVGAIRGSEGNDLPGVLARGGCDLAHAEGPRKSPKRRGKQKEDCENFAHEA